MGVNLKELVKAKEIELSSLRGKVIGVDAFNWTYQFLTTIRLQDGSPLMDSKGHVTSHISGIFFRNMNLLKEGIKPVWVWDGEPPEFKKREIEERIQRKEEAKEKLKEAKTLEEMKLYAMQSAQLTEEMIKDAIEVLDAMGIPSIKAKGEGEAQIAFMVKQGDLWASASQDWDSLLFGCPRLVRNLNIVGRRKLPRKHVWVEVRPELVELKEVLSSLGISREELIIIGLLIGTDYNPGIKGIGPKKALNLVKKYGGDVEKISKIARWDFEIPMKVLLDYFISPDVYTKYEIKWKPMNEERLMELMVEKHDFSRDRILKQIEEYKKKRFEQTSLSSFLKLS